MSFLIKKTRNRDTRAVRLKMGCYLGKEQDHVGQAFQPDGASSSGWKA